MNSVSLWVMELYVILGEGGEFLSVVKLRTLKHEFFLTSH